MNIPTAIFLIVSAFCFGVAAGGWIEKKFYSDAPAKSQENNKDFDDVLRLARHKKTRIMVVDVDRTPFAKADDLNSSQRQHVKDVIEYLSGWLGLPPATPAPAVAQKAIEPQATTPGSASATSPAPGIAPVITEPEESKPVVPYVAIANLIQPAVVDEVEPAKPPKVKRRSVFEWVTRAVEAEAPKLPYAPKSPAAQVNDIVQEKITGTPLEERRIKLIDKPNQEMAVLIGIEEFPTVDAVPDEEIRGILKQAVTEWLKRNLKH